MDLAEWNRIRKESLNKAEAEFASEASSIIRLTKEEILEIIGESAVDKDQLGELISEVNHATKSNSEKADAIRNITGGVEIAVSIIGKLV